MKAKGNFVFKGLDKRAGGEFINDKGQSVKYHESYILKVDEVTDGSINERKLKVDVNNTSLLNELNKLQPYDKIDLECDVVLYQNSAKVIPIAVSVSNNK